MGLHQLKVSTKQSRFDEFQWNNMDEAKQEQIINDEYRLAYRVETEVDWCEALQCKLPKDEIDEKWQK